jgi:glutathione S-transferase
MIFQMAGRARRGQNERVPPPPPPPPTLQELMAQQNEILRHLAQRQPPPQHYGGGDHQRHPAAATYQEFLSTQPPLFLMVVFKWVQVVTLLMGSFCLYSRHQIKAKSVNSLMAAFTWLLAGIS